MVQLSVVVTALFVACAAAIPYGADFAAHEARGCGLHCTDAKATPAVEERSPTHFVAELEDRSGCGTKCYVEETTPAVEETTPPTVEVEARTCVHPPNNCI